MSGMLQSSKVGDLNPQPSDFYAEYSNYLNYGDQTFLNPSTR